MICSYITLTNRLVFKDENKSQSEKKVLVSNVNVLHHNRSSMTPTPSQFQQCLFSFVKNQNLTGLILADTVGSSQICLKKCKTFVFYSHYCFTSPLFWLCP